MAETNYQRSFQRVLEDYLPLLRATVHRLKQKLPDAIEAEELHSIGLSGLVAAAHWIESAPYLKSGRL